VEGGNARDGRNCSRDGVLRNETNDRKHGKASVVQFAVLLDLHGLRLDTREVDRREDNRGKSSTVEVVGLLDLRGDFGNKESANNLPLACEYDMEKCVRRKCEAETVRTWSRLVSYSPASGTPAHWSMGFRPERDSKEMSELNMPGKWIPAA
jgi:hypothetical protein